MFVDELDEIVKEDEDRDYEHTCEWCSNIGTQYLMGQLFCDSCAERFRELHAQVNYHGQFHPER
jgi:hypothetical protein